ncbi:MAG: ATP-binding protein [Phycisphaerae bacterium]
MAKLDLTKFRVSSALKTIIGKELITDDFIAVFELVKNAFDAHAKRVDIIFENLYSGNSRLIIKDNGKGMDKIALFEKWLFVAYSAKKEGTEDYRDKIRPNRIYAGAKGIGRFSCDKLGSNLTIYTKKRGEKSINQLVIDWSDFEQDSKKEFVMIPVKYNSVAKAPFPLNRGTIIEITGLREGWDRSKFLKLRRSLEKLINPNQENDPRGFAIYLNVDEERINDLDAIDRGKSREQVNGKVQNSIFEDLKIKTTKIETIISKNGEKVNTTLEDRGMLIYEMEEENPYPHLLHDIRFNLFVLNRSAKYHFTKSMGIHSVQYGSVFLYKNGFRIYPFGEPGLDTLKIDHRKQQGTSRFFGTRDLIGRIEINGKNEAFQETSSRDGGLISNSSYYAIEDFFKDYVLKRLEKFAIGVIKWGNDGDLLDHQKLSPQEMKKRVSDIVYNLTKSENLLNINYNPKLIDILENRTEKSLKTILNRLHVLAEKTDNQLIASEIRRAQRQYKSLLKAKEEAEKSEREARKEAREAQKQVEIKESQNLFMQSVLSRDRKELLNFHHHIGIAAGAIEDYVKNLYRKIRKGTLSTDKILSSLQKISYQAEQIISISRFATKANFNFKANEIKADLIGFIKEHLLNVYSDILKFSGSRLRIQYEQVPNEKCVCKFKPIEITVILENLLSNSKKADASVVKVSVKKEEKGVVELVFSDNGKGIPPKDLDKIFEMGFSTTDGSGLGLYHVKDILRKNGGSIRCNPESVTGAEFIIRFKGIT